MCFNVISKPVHAPMLSWLFLETLNSSTVQAYLLYWHRMPTSQLSLCLWWCLCWSQHLYWYQWHLQMSWNHQHLVPPLQVNRQVLKINDRQLNQWLCDFLYVIRPSEPLLAFPVVHWIPPSSYKKRTYEEPLSAASTVWNVFVYQCNKMIMILISMKLIVI